MKRIDIYRGSTPISTVGDLYVDNAFVCHTVERPWLDNAPNLSCIPEGEYILEPYDSPKFGECYIVSGGTVEKFQNSNGNRWGILFHTANVPSQLHGCIAPVSEIKIMNIHGTSGNNELGGSSSRTAFNLLMANLDGEKCELVIKSKRCNDR